ncbi:MAG TPA: hypothetical protein VKY27_08505 [Bacteriovoracaceae bacterium]|nr:hypothetical protein [Bacteriovoracaceae bacterium]
MEYTIKATDIQLEITQAAKNQLRLMSEHDYTLKNQFFRIQIGGKECHGFTYQLGFTAKDQNDLEIKQDDLIVLMDPFTAYYTQEAKLDYQMDDMGNDGFTLTNFKESEHRGKFFKDLNKLPPWAKA